MFLENSSAGDSGNPNANQPSSWVALRRRGRGSTRVAETFHLITHLGATTKRRPPSIRMRGGWVGHVLLPACTPSLGWGVLPQNSYFSASPGWALLVLG